MEGTSSTTKWYRPYWEIDDASIEGTSSQPEAKRVCLGPPSDQASHTEHEDGFPTPSSFAQMLDFHNDFGDINMFDFCRRFKGSEPCGCYMPGFYWKQRTGKHKWKCSVDWGRINDHPNFTQVIKEMEKKHGPFMHTWPDPGCGAGFIPFARGGSKILEIKQSDGDVLVLMAERPPEILIDQMQGVHFNNALKGLTSQEIYNRIPCTLPKRPPTSVPGVFRFPVEEWKAQGSPTLTQAGWVALCWVVAQKDPQNLEHLIDICEKSSYKQAGAPADWTLVERTYKDFF